MDTLIKPIETRYDGTLFRSRLEARWAVFFDALNVRWEYEKEGYETPLGRYLPDFWLPDAGMRTTTGGGVLFEVKPLNWSVDSRMHPELEMVCDHLKVGGLLAVDFDFDGSFWQGLTEIAPHWDDPMMVFSCPRCKRVKFDYPRYYDCDYCNDKVEHYTDSNFRVLTAYLQAQQYRFW